MDFTKLNIINVFSERYRYAMWISDEHWSV